MNKKILFAGFLMAASLVQAEVLSWRVDIPDASGGNSSYVTAKLFSTTSVGSGYEITGDLVQERTKYNDTYGVLKTDSSVSFSSGIGFYVRLFDGATPAGYSALMSWSDLVEMGALVSGVLPDLPATTSWNAVPEPTSMALLAMGVSALLMRRKRRT